MVVLTELLQGSSSSSSIHDGNHIYDVFLSFRGADTRNSFTDHVYNALRNAQINTFLDDDEIETGEILKPELESAIKASRASIIVLSKNYAFSTWCLDELALILEQRLISDQIVIPIFYHVEPTHVRKQESSFGDAMAWHKQRMKAEANSEKRSQWAQKIDRWNKALTEVADLKGKDAKNRKETEFIEEIVTDIHRRLGVPLNSTPPPLIGRKYQIKFITSWLTDGSCHTADILTILGMGGIGKTTLAKYVFGLHRRRFHKSSFIEGINTRCNEQFNGLLDLQKQLCGDVSKKIQLQVHDVSLYTSKIENALACKKVLLVLDDVGNLVQLDALLGNKGFHPGSKIIITTKDASLAERCALFNPQVQPKHTEVLLEGLYETESLKLLCSHAFKSQNPKEGYKEVSEKLVKYCDGHPLALEVLGKSLHNRDVVHWEECIEKQKKETDDCINNILKMSFDSLPSKNDKDLFKHIACFFVGIDRHMAETILNACDIKTRSGITNLIDRCLLSIGWSNTLMMHQLIQEMGRDLVRQESPDKPWERSRLWCHEESFKVLEQKKGTENLLGLALDMRMLEKEKLIGSLQLKTDALSKMDNLKLLRLNYVKINGSYKNISKELRWLCMHGFHFKSIPSELPMENLVVLDMSHSNIESFDMSYSISQQFVSRLKRLIGSSSQDKLVLGSLKILDLSFCEQLHSLGGFFHLPALESLIVKKCISLMEVCESIEQCVELAVIDLSYCNKLEKLPRSIGKLKKVKTLLLNGCVFSRISSSVPRDLKSLAISLPRSLVSLSLMDNNLSNESFPMDLSSLSMLKALFLDGNPIVSMPICVRTLPRLEFLSMDGCHMKSLAISLPRSLVRLSLKDNNLSNESFPMDLSSLSMLQHLCLDGNPIVSIPICVRTLPRLETLRMGNCNKLMSIEHPPCTLRWLEISYSSYSVKNLYHQPSLRKIAFVPEMSPLNICMSFELLAPSSFEIEGMVKIQPMAGVEDKLLRSLGWTNLEFIIKSRVVNKGFFRGSEECQVQMYYEFGIFSTFYGGKAMPNWIRRRSKGPSISFTIPSSPKKLRGLNFCCVQSTYNDQSFMLPWIRISNITKNRTWIYRHYIEDVNVCGKWLAMLSHWMFGMNDMEVGDEITITVTERLFAHTKMCGVRVVYDDGKMEEEEGALGYYKSWNHIIGGDLSAFQTTTGEYFLRNQRFMLSSLMFSTEHRFRYHHPFSEAAVTYKEDEVAFKAFSQRKSGIVG